VCKQWNSLAKDKQLLKNLEDGFVYCGICSTLIGKEEDIICRVLKLYLNS
jgi:hypothetical protein